MNKEQQSLVSIAIITYNQKEFLRECIESCLEQDYKNTEIVVADDGSTDGTQDMLREYEKKYPGKFVLRLSGKNQGITKNSNLAHFACSGKYIAWMGGDDLMSPNKITLQVAIMEKYPEIAISYHNLDVFDSTSGELIKKLNSENSYSGYLNGYIRRGCVNGASSTMIRSEWAPTGGFNDAMPVASDWFYWCEILAHSRGRIEYIGNNLGKYRRHKENVTSKNSFFARQGMIDTVTACSLILSNYPQYTKSTKYRLGVLLRSMRKMNNYKERLFSSLMISFQLRTIILLVIYVSTFGRVKL